MHKVLLSLIVLILCSQSVFAYKVFSYNDKGERVYRTIEQKDFKKNKNRPRRAYIRPPRKSWEITDKMRARKKTTSDITHRK